MSDLQRVNPKYRGMLRARAHQDPHPADAVNASQAAEFDMEPGAHWAMEAAKLSYATGGNEGDWDKAHHPDDPERGPDPT